MKRKENKKDTEGLALAAVHDRVKETRKKPFNQRTIAELIEFSHMGLPIEQYDIGVEIEQLVRETVSDLVTMAFHKSDQTFMMVNRLNNKISSLENLFKTDSERLSELARLDKQV